MSNTFDDAERLLLRTLRQEPAWHSLLEKLTPDPIPSFSPKLETDGKSQYETFIYESGFADGANNLISMLKDSNA